MNNGKKAQVEVTFNWIYIVIAGAVILLFFAGIIVKQKIASEEGLDRDVMRIMENIFTAAQVSENTKTVIDMGGLKDYVFYFKCEEGVSKYGLEGRSMPVEDQANPIFAPSQIQSSLLITWSVPYKLPFKVIDFMFVTSGNTKYFLWGKSDLSEDFLRAISNVSASNKIAVNFNTLTIDEVSQIDPGKNFQIRLIDFEGKLKTGEELPGEVEEKIKYLPAGRVTAVSFHGSGASTFINFFVYDQGQWKKYNKDPLPVISLGGEGDAAFYAAIFSGDDQVYQCNMRKAFQRLSYLNEIYGGTELATKGEAGGKLKEIISFYDAHPELAITGECLNYLINDQENVQETLQSHQNAANACLTLFTGGKLPAECSELVSTAVELRETNNNLMERGDCIPLY